MKPEQLDLIRRAIKLDIGKPVILKRQSRKSTHARTVDEGKYVRNSKLKIDSTTRSAVSPLEQRTLAKTSTPIKENEDEQIGHHQPQTHRMRLTTSTPKTQKPVNTANENVV
jgi:hypothetical protein